MTHTRTSQAHTAGMTNKQYAKWLHEQACFSREEACALANFDEVAEARQCAAILVYCTAAFCIAAGIVSLLFWR